MIAADTSVLIDYFQGINNTQTEQLDEVLSYHSLILPPTVLVEILSDPGLPKKFLDKIEEIPLLEMTEHYWQRAGLNRAKLISKKLKVCLADTLIAQSCIDNKISLITRDSGFQHFAKYCGLLLF